MFRLFPKTPLLALVSIIAPIMAVGGCAPTAWDDRVQAWQVRQGPTSSASFTLTDGTYKGVAELVTASGPDCPAGRNGIITIGDQRLVYAYTPRITFIAPLRADGSLRASMGGATLEGLVGNGDLSFSVRTPTCESRYRLRWTM